MLKASEVLAATKAVCADFEFTGVTTDSRAVKPGELFVALKGDNFDGHDYCAKAVELGAAGVVVSHEVSGLLCSWLMIHCLPTSSWRMLTVCVSRA